MTLEACLFVSSAVIPMWIYLLCYDNPGNLNDCPYIPKQIRNSGWRAMIKLCKDKLYYIGDTIVSHSENIKTRRHIHN